MWYALHVSGGSSAHHQELKIVYTTSSTSSNLHCCFPLSWKKWNCNCSSISSTTVAGSSKVLTKYPMLYIQFWAPDDGRRNRLKHVEYITKKKNYLCNVAFCWLYLKIRLPSGLLPSGLQTKPCMNFSSPVRITLWQSKKLVYSKHKYRSAGQYASHRNKLCSMTYNNYRQTLIQIWYVSGKNNKREFEYSWN